jgi:PAS domain S-box-containing protein
LEFRAVRKDGSTVWIDAFSNRVEYLGRPAVQGLFLDIEARKKAQDTLKASEEKYRDLTNSLPEIVFEADLNGNMTFLNPRGFEILGMSNEEFEKGSTIFQFLVPEDRERARENLKKTFAGEIKSPIEYRIIGAESKVFSVLIRASPRVSGNKVIGLRGLVMDITERKEAEERLVESEQKYRDIFESARDAIYVHDLNGKIISVNKIVEEFGFTKEQIVGHNMLDFIPKKYWAKLEDNLSCLANGIRVQGETEVNTPIGKRSAEYRSNPIFRDGKVISVHSVLRDTTNRKKYEEAMFESQQKFKALFTGNPEAAVFIDTDFHVIEANSRFSKLFGYSFDEIKGKVITDFIVSDEFVEESKTIQQKILTAPIEVVTQRKRKDGSLVFIILLGAPVTIRDKVIGSVVVYKDISEIISVQDALSKALATAELLNEKLSIVGGFVRHDVRNKLCAINGNVFLLNKKVNGDSTASRCLDQIKGSSESIVRILNFAASFESLGNEKLVPMDVGLAFEQAASLFNDLKGIKIINGCQGFQVLADSMLTTIFHNLIDNSIKYGEKLSQIRLSWQESADGSKTMIYEDDGAGIDGATKQRLFEKGIGKGTGLGLYLIKKAIDVYGWKISEEGIEGSGVKFSITVPKTR